MTVTIMHADARALPLADDSVDLVVTSPPYFALRTYTDNGAHYDRQIGAEDSPDAYVSELLAVTRECMRVLKPTGSLWVNLGDKYSGGGGYSPDAPSNVGNNRHGDGKGGRRSANNGGKTYGIAAKSLIGIPWRYALRCVDELGLVWRAEVIWDKPNGLPESVTDRVRRSHEVWLHFTMQPRYYSAVDEIRETYSPATAARYASGYGGNARANNGMHNNGMHRAMSTDDAGPTSTNPLGKLPGSVWQIPTEPLHVPPELGVDHYAAFPTEWPRRIIAGWSPLPAVVLDPFGGTGTTALVADVLGRDGISVDLSRDYCRIAEWRTSDPGQRAHAARKPKPPRELAGQADLLTMLDDDENEASA